MAEEPTGAREERKRTQTAGEIALDVTDFGEGLVWLFVLDLKERCGVSLSDGSGELSGLSHKVCFMAQFRPHRNRIFFVELGGK